jgi:hypothetical protein
MDGAAVEDEESVEDEDAAHQSLSAAIAAIATSKPATRVRRIRTRWVVVPARSA